MRLDHPLYVVGQSHSPRQKNEETIIHIIHMLPDREEFSFTDCRHLV